MKILTILQAIPSTEETDFRNFCRDLGEDKPEKGDREGWADVFKKLREAEKEGLVEISWTDNQVDTLVLTEAGANLVRTSSK